MSPYKAHCLEEFCSNYPSSRKPMWGVEFNFSGDELPVKTHLGYRCYAVQLPSLIQNISAIIDFRALWDPWLLLTENELSSHKKAAIYFGNSFCSNEMVCQLFQKLYPDDEFFPETINTDSSDKLDDDGDLLES
ncbi:hypothetical protein Tco_0783580 [Tanacetum coccineum]